MPQDMPGALCLIIREETFSHHIKIEELIKDKIIAKNNRNVFLNIK